jgi:methionine synthase reductase
MTDIKEALNNRGLHTASKSVVILYGSQTGNGEEIAKSTHTSLLRKLNNRPEHRGDLTTFHVYSMQDYVKLHQKTLNNLCNETLLIIICSTTGNGDPPDNAMKFVRLLNRIKDSTFLASVRYSLLGLGDTNYDQFCATAKKIWRKLQKLGAKPFTEPVFADDATNIATQVEPWANTIATKVHNALLETSPLPPPPSSTTTTVNGTAAVTDPESDPTVKVNSHAQPVKVITRKKPKLHVEKPKLLAKFRKRTLKAQFVNDGSVSELHTPEDAQTLLGRFAMHDSTESELKGYTPEAPFMVAINDAYFLTAPDAEKHVLHVEFDFLCGKDSVVYHTGDALGVYCPNEYQAVTALLERLDLTAYNNTPFSVVPTAKAGDDATVLHHLEKPTTPLQALLYYYDITSPPRKMLLRMLAEYCSEPAERERLYYYASATKQAKADYEADIQRPQRTIQEILDMFPSCMPDFAHLLEQLPLLKPRYYSASSSPSVCANGMQVALTVVNWDAPGANECKETVKRRGLCSNWLYHLCRRAKLLEGDADHYQASTSSNSDLILPGYSVSSNGRICVPMFLRRSTDFTMPQDISKPIIMIGPGTGVAPFRGFCLQRRSQKLACGSGARSFGAWRGLDLEMADESVEEEEQVLGTDTISTGSTFGEALLFFGCRRRNEDFLYRKDLESFVQDGTLTNLYTAFSRETESKVYVQHRIREVGGHVVDLILEQNGCIFVCGDGGNMARDVRACMTDIFVEHAGMTQGEATAFVFSLMKEGRFVQDIWS